MESLPVDKGYKFIVYKTLYNLKDYLHFYISNSPIYSRNTFNLILNCNDYRKLRSFLTL